MLDELWATIHLQGVVVGQERKTILRWPIGQQNVLFELFEKGLSVPTAARAAEALTGEATQLCRFVATWKWTRGELLF